MSTVSEQDRVYDVIRAAKGHATAATTAGEMGMPTANMQRILDAMERKAMVISSRRGAVKYYQHVVW